MKLVALVLAGALVAPTSLFAAVLDFEDVTSSAINVSPSAPYAEDGFIVRPETAESAVFDSGFHRTGIDSDVYGFAAGNAITITAAGGAPFSFESLVATLNQDPEDPGAGTMSVTGFFAAGGSSMQLFLLSPGTVNVIVSFTGLSSLVLSTDAATMIDDVTLNVSSVPLPAAGLMLPAALLGFGALRRRRG